MSAPATAQAITFRAGDVIRYTPAGMTITGVADYHFREGTAVVGEDGRALDTFGNSDPHLLTRAELESGQVLFNTEDYVKLGEQWETRNKLSLWEQHRPEDRQEITHQHGSQATLYLRKGAKPDMNTRLANARELVAKAEAEVRSAEGTLTWRREQLAKLEAEAAEAVSG